MEEKDEIKSCPGSEVLEEYRDGTASCEWTSHIDNCAHCQRRIASLDLLDLRIRKVCQPPDGIAARIKSAVHDGREPSIRPVPFWRVSSYRIATAAAVLVLLSISLYIGMYDGHQGIIGGVPDSPPVVFEPPARTAEEGAMAEKSQSAIAQDGISVKGDASVATARPTISLNPNLRLAGTYMEESSAKRKREVQKQSLGEMVRHIWSVKNKDDAKDFIQKVAKANDINVEIKREEGGFQALIELKDTELQQLVDMLDARGWRLLSPYMPQPREADVIEFRGIPVKYYVNAIEDGN